MSVEKAGLTTLVSRNSPSNQAESHKYQRP